MVGGAISGGSLNPARVFGPAIASGHFAHHYVWWIGPIAGGIVAGFVYELLFADKKEQLPQTGNKGIEDSHPSLV